MTSHAAIERADHRSITPTGDEEELSSSAAHEVSVNAADGREPEPTAGKEPPADDGKPAPASATLPVVDLEDPGKEDVEKISLWEYHVDASKSALVFTLLLV